jgi:hypothetical protein
MDSGWTINNGQLALNKYFRNELDTKIFSIYEKDVKVYFAEKEEGKEDESTQIKPMAPSRVNLKRPKPSGLFGESDSDIDENVQSPNLRRTNEIGHVEIDNTNFYDSILKMYEKLTLKGSYIKSIKDVKLIDHSMEISYDHKYGKFYGLVVSSQNSKVVLVAQDMSQMQEAVFTHAEDIPDLEISKEPTNLKMLVQNATEFFMHFERLRFVLPWRWRRWSTVFSIASNPNSGIKENKIAKRLEKIKEWELNNWRIKFGLEQIIVNKKNKQAVTKNKTPAYIASSIYSTPNYNQDNKEFKSCPVRVEERKLRAFVISGDVKTLKLLFSMIQNTYKKFKIDSVLKIFKILDENKAQWKLNKSYNGPITNAQFLQKHLVELFKKYGNDEHLSVATEYVLLTMLLQELVYWIRTSDTLSASPTEGDPKLLDQVGQFLLDAACTKEEKI